MVIKEFYIEHIDINSLDRHRDMMVVWKDVSTSEIHTTSLKSWSMGDLWKAVLAINIRSCKIIGIGYKSIKNNENNEN